MKKAYISLIVMIITFHLVAKPATEFQLKTVARNWLGNLTETNLILNSYGTLPTEHPNLIYYFNFEPGGFVILASDNQTEPILAFQVDKTIDPNYIPPAAMQLFNHYAEQIAFVQENQLRYPEQEIRWEQLLQNDFSAYNVNTRNVEPLITAKWDQGSPYNMYCPTMYGQHTLVGCVAVAMAQIMRFHQYPEQGIGSHSYNWNGQTISADFSATSYDWSNMPNQVYNYSPFIQRQAVATLLFHSGVGVNMDYGLDGSGAQSNHAEYALRYYFGYSSTIDLINKDSYTIDSFIEILIDNLEASQPMYYAGHDNNMGHAFVCDGYQGSNHFHFNWGWSGSYDGYYYLHSLTPGYSNFNYGQHAIVNIKKPVITSPPLNLSAMVLGNDVVLMWEIPDETDSLTGYNIYRNGINIDFIPGVESASYYDAGLNSGEYEYFVTSKYYETHYIQPESEPSNVVEIVIGTSITEHAIPSAEARLQNFPNPFNPETTIRFYLQPNEQNDRISLEIFNTKGQKIKEFSREKISSGINQLVWEGRDADGNPVSSGLYFAVLRTSTRQISKKMMLLK